MSIMEAFDPNDVWVPQTDWIDITDYWPEPETGDIYEVRLKDGTTVVGLFQDWGFENIDDENFVWAGEYGNEDELVAYRVVIHEDDLINDV